MGQWTGPYFRASLCDGPPAVRSGQLIDVLAPAIEILDQADVDQDVVRCLRVLIAAITPDL
ncbi:hypothetical protein AB0D27_25545 [Streptomyces sp. NPDC048415]|uniref:hypothetical protein n=1 Tax=Streptomyces sp. NPDC048415 TaxID=3154822 RepID=UPI0034206D5A